VEAAVLRAMRSCASPGRGSHAAAMRAADAALDCRIAAAGLFGVDSPENVIFTQNATHALNIALQNLVRPGDRVVVSGYEHNAVTRPLHALGARMDVVRSPLFDADLAAAAFAERLHEAKAAVCTYVSNVFGFIFPIERIAALCRAAGVPLVIDASQGAGSLPIDLAALRAAYIAMPGHKGLLGPQGTGLLLCRKGTDPILYGGTGSSSASQDMPDFLPDRLEAGTHNIPGIAGLLAGIEAVRGAGTDVILAHERRLLRAMASRLEEIPGLRVFRARNPDAQAGVLSVLTERCSCEELSEALGERGVGVRAGRPSAPVAPPPARPKENGAGTLN
jgi:selenocysteine lyase/cysteine desulfurase